MNIYNMKSPFFSIDKRLLSVSERAQKAAAESFFKIDEITEYNQQKVLAAFIENRISETHFNPTTGYGYGDEGKDTLSRVFCAGNGSAGRACQAQYGVGYSCNHHSAVWYSASRGYASYRYRRSV